MEAPGPRQAVTFDEGAEFSTITIDDGKVNALSLSILAEVNLALDQALRADVPVIITGRDGRFSAGFDLGTLTGGGPDAPTLLRRGFELAERMLSFSLPVVVACSGHAIAMGSFLLLSADVRIGAEGEFKIGANEVSIGMTMPTAAIELCRLRIPTTHLSRVLSNAEMFSPSGAVGAGFLDAVASPADLGSRAAAAAATLGRVDLAAHAATKLLWRAPALSAISAGIESDHAAFTRLIA